MWLFSENLVQYITGLEMEEMLADLGTVVDGRALEDDASVLIHYKGGARGILYCSQISTQSHGSEDSQSSATVATPPEAR